MGTFPKWGAKLGRFLFVGHLGFLFLRMWHVGPIFNPLHLRFFSRQLAKLSSLTPPPQKKHCQVWHDAWLLWATMINSVTIIFLIRKSHVYVIPFYRSTHLRCCWVPVLPGSSLQLLGQLHPQHLSGSNWPLGPNSELERVAGLQVTV
jgi:hypothetical protein